MLLHDRFSESCAAGPQDDSQAGGYHNPVLRKWWRGSIGLTRHEQAAAFATPQVVPGEDDESDTEEDDDLPVVEVQKRVG